MNWHSLFCSEDTLVKIMQRGTNKCHLYWMCVCTCVCVCVCVCACMRVCVCVCKKYVLYHVNQYGIYRPKMKMVHRIVTVHKPAIGIRVQTHCWYVCIMCRCSCDLMWLHCSWHHQCSQRNTCVITVQSPEALGSLLLQMVRINHKCFYLYSIRFHLSPNFPLITCVVYIL